MRQIDLVKKGAGPIARFKWSTWIRGNVLEWHDHKARRGSISRSAIARTGRGRTRQKRLTLPTPDTDAVKKLGLDSDEHSRYHDEVWLANIVTGHQLLGWPSQMNHHAYKGWELLAQVDFDDVMGLEIGDVETMRFHIDGKQLAKKQFGNVTSEIGGD